MSDYRYVVFPRGKQPTVGEVAALRELASQLAVRAAFGTCRKAGGLAIAFPASDFEVAARHRRFSRLLEKWSTRGAESADKLGFVKDPTALRPMQTLQPETWPDPAPDDSHEESTANSEYSGRPLSTQKILTAKELAASDALGRSLLGVQRTLARYATIERFAVWVPCAMIAIAALTTILVGFYVGNRLLDSGLDRRHDTIEPVVKNGNQEAPARLQSE